MMDLDFKTGNMVSLKSGGAAMVIEALVDDLAQLVWMDKQARTRRDQLPTVCLRHSSGQFDGVRDLVIEGVTHSTDQLVDYLETAGRA